MYYVYHKERPLTKEDRDWHLPINEKRAASNAGMMVIRMNSTFLELVGPGHEARGMAGTYGLVYGCLILFMTPFFWINFFLKIYYAQDSHVQDFGETLFLGTIHTLILGAFFVFILKLMRAIGEWFGYTHYPVRLNRKNRTMYAFIGKDKPLEVSWDDLYFVLAMNFLRHRYICANILKDKNTVATSINFGFASLDSDLVLQHWEFIRRYMEDGPENLMSADGLEVCLPVAEKRESLYQGWLRLFNYYGGGIASYCMVPVVISCFIGRLVNRATSKVPYWPAEVEAVCQIDPNDPYVRDERQNPEWFQG